MHVLIIKRHSFKNFFLLSYFLKISEVEAGGAYADDMPEYWGIDVRGDTIPEPLNAKPGPSSVILPHTHFSPKNTHARVNKLLMEEIRIR